MQADWLGVLYKYSARAVFLQLELELPSEQVRFTPLRRAVHAPPPPPPPSQGQEVTAGYPWVGRTNIWLRFVSWAAPPSVRSGRSNAIINGISQKYSLKSIFHLNKNHIHPHKLQTYIFHWNLHFLFRSKVRPPYLGHFRFQNYPFIHNARVATQSLKDCYHATKQLFMNYNEGYIPEGS